MVTAPRFIPAPPATPPKFGLLSVADVRDDMTGRTALGAQYFTDACIDTIEAPEWCPVPPGDPAPPKTVTDGRFLATSVEFAAYSLLRCRLVGADLDQVRVDNVLRLSESRAIERGFMSRYLAMADDPGTDEVEQAVDLTPAGGAVCPTLGLALLESYAAQNYGGTPVIHTARDVGSLLFTRSAIERQSGRLETGLGALVAAGGGYSGASNLGPGGTVTPAGESWMYVTGQVVVLRGPTAAVSPVLVQNETGGYLNEFDSFIERVYSVMGECIKAAIRVTVNCDEAAVTP